MITPVSSIAAWLDDVRAGFSALKPSRFPYRRFCLALVLGFGGGLLFQRLALPLPWMMGPMLTCTVASLMRAPVAAPPVIRPPMTMVIGVMLGAAFSPDLMTRILQWWPATLGLLAFIALCGGSVVWYFRRVGGYDRTTAYFAGMPGGLVEMISLGRSVAATARSSRWSIRFASC